jgi:hypothetical protein
VSYSHTSDCRRGGTETEGTLFPNVHCFLIPFPTALSSSFLQNKSHWETTFPKTPERWEEASNERCRFQTLSVEATPYYIYRYFTILS